MADPITVVLGTATPGGGFPAYGEPYAEVLNEVESGLRLEPPQHQRQHRKRPDARSR